MNDIFISYAREDRSRVQRLAAALENRGWSVWWDPQIPAGQSFDDVIAQELAESRCIIVAWSAQSVNSHWVREEAESARGRGVLVPVLLDRVAPPLGFGRIQSADLAAWDGDASAPEFDRLVTDIGRCINAADAAPAAARNGSTPSPGALAARQSSRGAARKRAAIAIAAGVVALVSILGVYQLNRPSPGAADGGSDNTPHKSTPDTRTQDTSAQDASPQTTSTQARPPPRDETQREAPAHMASAAMLPNRVDLLSTEQGGQLLVADSDYWLQAADGNEDKFSFYAGMAQAVYGFKDGRRATFDTFAVLIEEADDYNLKEFELLVGDESPTGSFRSLGRFTTQNAKLLTTPYQQFRFAATSARYFKVKLLSSFGASYIGAREFRLLGKLPATAPGSDTAKAHGAPLPPQDAVDLLAADQGGQLLVADSNYWLQATDGKQDKFSFYAGAAEAVYGFKDGRRAAFDTFAILIEDTDDYNLKEFELLAGDDSPTGSFRSLGRFTTQNVKLFTTPYQLFRFQATTAKYLKVKLLSSYGATYIGAREFRLLGKLPVNGSGSDTVKTPAVPLPPQDAVDLLAADQGGQLLVADSNYWLQATDGKQDKFSFYAATAEAVYGFKDQGRATFDTFTTLIEDTDDYNLKEFELLVGDDSPTGSFRSLGRFTTRNAKLFTTPYQQFRFEATSAKFLKVKLLSSYGATYIGAREFQLWGKPGTN